MTSTSFLARRTFGQPRYLLAALAAAFVLAFIPVAARRALDSSSNKVEDWLPASYAELQDLQWFRAHFGGDQFALVSWDGCTLGNAERLELLARKLTAKSKATSPDSVAAEDRSRWYARVTTGPRVIRELVDSQLGLTYAAAVNRLEGSLVGPPRRDAHGRSLGDDTRTTCLVVHLSDAALEDKRSVRAAVDGISKIAAAECGIDPATIHMGGPPVDNATLEAESVHTLARLGPIAGIVGIGLCYWRLRSARLTAIVVAVGASSAGLSLAVVFYFGVIEVLAGGKPAPNWGTLDAVLMAMPAIVYLLATSAAMHFLNYYLDARRDQWVDGAAERAVAASWRPSTLAALAAAAGMAALVTSDIVPMQKFGVFAAVAMILATAVLFVVAPVVLHRYPQNEMAIRRRAERRERGRLAAAFNNLFRFVVHQPALTLAFWTIAIAALGLGMTRLKTSVQALDLLDRDADLIQDYAWLEQHLGNLVPMEVVVTIPPERLRSGDEHAEEDGQQYRLTMLERVELLRRIARRLEEFPQISQAVSAAAFAPASSDSGAGGDRGADYVTNKALELHRNKLLDTDYLRIEQAGGGAPATRRELWRLSARVAAKSKSGAPIDYGVFVEQLRRAVDPVLMAYQQRDLIIHALHEQGKQLAGARVCVLFRGPQGATTPAGDVQEHALAELLHSSGVAPRGVSYFNLALFQAPGRGDAAKDDQYRRSAAASLEQQDAVILASAATDPVAKQLAGLGVRVVDVTEVARAVESTAVHADDGGPRPIQAVFTGVAPVMERAQRELLGSLTRSLLCAAGLATIVVTLGYMSVSAGLLAMMPSVFPLVSALGMMGWLGAPVDVGVAVTAAVALALAIEGAVHFIHWFQRAQRAGMSRPQATLCAYDRCGVAMIEIAIVAGLGLGVLGFSAFTPVREFGLMIVAMLLASLAGNLLILPAILASPLGWFLAPAEARQHDPLWPKVEAWWAARQSSEPELAAAPVTIPVAPAPHFVEEPAPTRRSILATDSDERRELADGPHAALHAKLQALRRPRTGDSASS